MPEYMTPQEVADEVRVTRKTVYEWLRGGQLRGVRAGKRWRISREDLTAFLERHQREGQE